MKYVNTLNNYETTDGGKFSWLWCLLFGPIYFAVRGNWGWFFLAFFFNLITFGIAALITPFFVYKINRTHLLRSGFKVV